MKFIIKNEQIGQRLDKFILAQRAGYSRAYLKKQIKEGQILVNQETKKPSYILKENDEIEAQILPPRQISLEPDSSIKLNIVYEDKDVIVIDKPAGLTVHPGADQKSGTLINGLLSYYPLLADVSEDPTRPGIVHRLDKDTSGLMIVAKNNAAFNFLKNQFQQRKVEKKYLALVVGHPENSSGQIKTFITRSKSDPTKQKVEPWAPGTPDSHLNKSSRAQAQGETPHRRPLPDDYQIRPSGAREALTLYKVIKNFRDFSLIEAQPKTGRMHQIRVHLAWLGCPVAGDKKYGPKKRPAPKGLQRQFLHATRLKIKLPNGQIKEFNSPLLPDLQSVLDNLK